MQSIDLIKDVASRGERAPFVRFERTVVADHAKSLEAGQFVGRDMDIVNVTPPDSKDVFKQDVNDWFSQRKVDVESGRFPQEWFERFKKQYAAWKEGQELPLEGTPIKGWGVISPAQQDTLIAMHVLTVEDCSKLNEDELRRIGMGALDVRNKARAWLLQLKDKGPLTVENAALKAQVSTLAGQVETLSKQVAALLPLAKARAEVQEEAQVEAITADDLLEPEDLTAAYVQKFGHAPHHRMKRETIAAKLKE